MDAIRSLGRAVLVLDHLKQDDGTGQDRPFGSVYTRNLARSLWTMKRLDAAINQVEFTHRKANHRAVVDESLIYEIEWDQQRGINAYPTEVWGTGAVIDMRHHFAPAVS